MRRCLLILVLAAGCLGRATVAQATEPPVVADGGRVLIGGIQGTITSVTLEYVRKTVARAEQDRSQIVLLEMDTPGGLVSSTEEIIQVMLASRVPIVVYVSPAGAQAASGGLYIANAADVIAMAPGTRIGAGHPVGIFGTKPGGEGDKGGRDYMGEKIENDLAAGVRSIATNRGRNAAVYEKMVRESISLTEREALDQKVIDLVVKSRDELLAALDGREIARFDGSKQTLSLAHARVDRFEMSRRQKILAWISDPNVAFILLAIAVLGLYVEFNNPGLVAPGVVGGVALILFAMSVQILPVNILGLLLIAVAVALFILEIKFTSHGLLTVAGVIALTLGFLTMFDTEAMPSLRVSLAFILPTSITIGLVMAFVTTVAVRAQRTKVVTGEQGLRGEIGEAVTDVGVGEGPGKVFVHGEYWNARSSEPIERGRKVRVKAVRSMDLEVEPADR